MPVDLTHFTHATSARTTNFGSPDVQEVAPIEISTPLVTPGARTSFLLTKVSPTIKKSMWRQIVAKVGDIRRVLRIAKPQRSTRVSGSGKRAATPDGANALAAAATTHANAPTSRAETSTALLYNSKAGGSSTSEGRRRRIVRRVINLLDDAVDEKESDYI